MKFGSALLGLAALATTAPLSADHHGRGKEQVNGFPGVYDVGSGRMTFAGDGYAIVVLRSSQVPVAIYSYKITDGYMTILDVSSPTFFAADDRKCAMKQYGTYLIHDIEGGFQLIPIHDPCEAREKLLTRDIYKDYVRPEAQ